MKIKKSTARVWVLYALATLTPRHALTAQTRNPTPGKLLGIVRTAAHKPVADAEVRFYRDIAPRLACLQDWRTALVDVRPKPSVTSTDAGGRFRLQAAGPGGAVLVRSPKGPDAALGALVTDLLPAQPRAILVQPMGEVRFSTSCTVWVQTVLPSGAAIGIGSVRDADRMRLPAGEYRLLALHKDTITEHQVRLRPTQVVSLAKPGGARRTLVLPQGFRGSVHLRHWRWVELPIRDGFVALPAGPSPSRMVVFDGEQKNPHAKTGLVREVWVDKDRFVLAAIQPRTRRVRVWGSARIVLARMTLDGLRVESVNRSGGKATELLLPPADDGDRDRLLIVEAHGRPARIMPLPPQGDIDVTLAKGHPLHLQVLDVRGDFAARAAVELSWPGQPLLTRIHHADPNGVLRLADVRKGPVTLRLVDGRYLDREYRMSISPGADNRKTIRAEPGFRVFGRVLLPGGKPAVGAAVTLRDSSGVSGRPPRRVVTGKNGRFEVIGLPEHEHLLLSARHTHAGQSYISKQLRVVAGGDEWEVTLKSEDPQLPGRRKQAAFARDGGVHEQRQPKLPPKFVSDALRL